MNKSLYNLIKEISQEKGRKLKVICDWDECLQPLKAAAIFKFYEGKLSFKEFFELFWENAVMEGSFSSGGKIIISLRGKEEKEAIEKYMKMRETMRNSREEYNKSFYGSLERWKTPLTSISEELLQCLKESLISELVIISSYRKGQPSAITKKETKMKKTFGNFSEVKIELTEVSKDERGKYKPYRWEVMQNKYPGWDIFIDDNPNIVSETIKSIPDQNKFYVLPDYKTNRHVKGDNLYHVKTTVSDLKNIDFAIGALEYRTNKLEQVIQELKVNHWESKPPNPSVPTWLIAFSISSLIFPPPYLRAKKAKWQKRDLRWT
jgi:hypothetical protein